MAAIHYLGVCGVRETEAKTFEPLPGHRLLIFCYEPEADGR